jgi:ligand-binding sensor domain-containing protein
MKRIVLLLAIIWGGARSGLGQHFQYTFYTEKNGLSNKAVSGLLTDDQGFLWVATAVGLNRFDGNDFEKFYNDPADSGSIADNNIQKLLLDAKDRLWIGTNAGLSLYHPRTNDFSNYEPDNIVLPQRGISFGALCDDRSGNIWVGTKNELLVFHPDSHHFTSSGWSTYAAAVAPANSNHFRVVVLDVIKRNRDELWILSTYGLFSVNTQNMQFKYYPYPGIKDYNGCHLTFADPHGTVWISTYANGLLSFNPSSGKFDNYAIPPAVAPGNQSSDIIPYSPDSLLYCSLNAVALLDITRKISVPWLSNDQDEPGLSTDVKCNTIMRCCGLLWLATNKGLVRIKPFNPPLQFVPLTNKANIERVFKVPSNGKILFSTFEKAPTTYVTGKGSSPVPIQLTTGGILHSDHQYFAAGKDDQYYLNGSDDFYRYYPESNTARPVPMPPKPNPGDPFEVRNMVVDRNGKVWIRTVKQGVLLYDPATDKIAAEPAIPIRKNSEFIALYYDSLTHTIWAAEEYNGVYVYDIAQKKLLHFTLNKPPSQKSACIISITGDGNGKVWMIDLQEGLVEFDHTKNLFTRYTANDGLGSNNCSRLVRDSRGLVWIVTDAGVTRYDPVSHQFTNLGANEGFPVALDTYLSADKKGNVYFPFNNGYYCWNTDGISVPAKDGRLYTRDVQLFDKHLSPDTNYRFSAGQNNIRFLFGFLAFTDRERLKLEYKLNGNTWLSSDIHSYISFANLAPGKYDLYVRIKNEQIPHLHIAFTVGRPFWEAEWFLGALLALVIAVIIFINRNRLKRERKESTLRQKIMESEMSALRSQMNPHFIFNTLNSINSYIIENKKDEASDYLADFSKLMRLILDHSQKRTITLTEECYGLKLYLELESRRLDSSFDYRIDVEADVDPTSIMMPPLVIQPFVENAIWHGLRSRKTGGNIHIRILHHNGGLLIVVEDDGVGRSAAGKLQKPSKETSFGTTATVQRILLNDPSSSVIIEDLYDPHGIAEGTRVNIYVNQNS